MKMPKELREKAELSGPAEKGKKCSIKECGEFAVRSVSENTWEKILEKAKLKYDENKFHKIFLCKKHYKEANKIRQKDEKLIQKKGFLEDSHITRNRSKYNNIE